MISIDVSKIAPPKAFEVLTAFIPGLFFEISVLLANPALVRELADQANVAYHFGYYLPLTMAAVAAFVIGVASILLVGIIQTVFIRAQTLKRLLWKPSSILANINRLLQKPGFNRNRLLLQFRNYIINKELSQRPLELVEALYRATNVLLQKHYGMEPLRPEKFDLDLWGPALAPLKYENVWGNLFLQAIHATGWCGLTAIHFAPSLKNTYFMWFSLFLILQGIWHSWVAAKRLCDPKLYYFMTLRTMLAQLGQKPVVTEHRSNEPKHQNIVPTDAPHSD